MWGLPGALSETLSCTVRLPAPCGVKRTAVGLDDPAAMEKGGKNVLSAVNPASAGKKLKLEIDNAALPGLFIWSCSEKACGVVIPTADGPRSIGEAGVVLKPGVPC